MASPILIEEETIKILDQTKLPGELAYVELDNVQDVYDAIRELKVRGAPAIGIAGAYGVYIAARNSMSQDTDALVHEIKKAGEYLISSRPTAVNLEWAVRRMLERLDHKVSLIKSSSQGEKRTLIIDLLKYEAIAIHKEDEEICRKIGENGAPLLEKCRTVLTHCNAGTIATARYGTALSPIYYLNERGHKLHTYADETRPLLQGSRLTTWELMEAGIDVTLITDNMAGFVMARKGIDAVIVGADRIAANGDVANKIGTYGLSILAHEHNIPFYVAAPISTFDFSIDSGDDIPIEERKREEVIYIGDKLIAPLNVDVYNPAFDVTPSRYVTAIITEAGIIKAPYSDSIKKLTSNK